MAQDIIDRTHTPVRDSHCTAHQEGALVRVVFPDGSSAVLDHDQATALAASILSAVNASKRAHPGGAS